MATGDLLWWSPGQDHVLLDASPDSDLYVIGLTPELSACVLGQDNLAALAGATRIRLEPVSARMGFPVTWFTPAQVIIWSPRILAVAASVPPPRSIDER